MAQPQNTNRPSARSQRVVGAPEVGVARVSEAGKVGVREDGAFGGLA
jgi:hypothetical protein